jgi:hypothetical protein
LKVECREELFSEYVANNECWEVVFDEDALKVTNESRHLFADDGDKNDDKSQITFSVFLFNGTYAEGSSGSLCIYPTKSAFWSVEKRM